MLANHILLRINYTLICGWISIIKLGINMVMNLEKERGLTDRVLALVEKSLKHLIIYSTHVRGFSFTKIDGSAIDPQKTVLQEEIDGMVLNVVIKAHLIDIHTFEITIITAMCVDDFRIFDGQYVIDIHGNTSTLLRKESKKMLEICSI